MDLRELLTVLSSPAGIALSLALVALLFGVAVMLRRVTRGASDGWIFVKALVVGAALIATSVTAAGMWKYFGDVFKIDNVWLRTAMFAFIEVAMLTEALLARRYRLANDGRRNVDAYAVWALAILSGFLSATDAHDWREALGRFAPPLVAAFLWERFLAAEVDAKRPEGAKTIHWRISVERVAVWLRLADATEQDVLATDRHRRLSALATVLYHHHRRNGFWRLVTITGIRARRGTIAANRLLGLATDPLAMRELQAMAATLYGVHTATTAAAVAGMAPWEVATQAATDQAEAAAAAATAQGAAHAAAQLAAQASDRAAGAVDAVDSLREELRTFAAGVGNDVARVLQPDREQLAGIRAAFERAERERVAEHQRVLEMVRGLNAAAPAEEAPDASGEEDQRSATEEQVREWLAEFLDDSPGWTGSIRAKVEALMRQHGCRVNSSLARRLHAQYEAAAEARDAMDDELAQVPAQAAPVTPTRSAVPDEDDALAAAGQR